MIDLAQKARGLLDYSIISGHLTWVKAPSPWHQRLVGKRAGFVNSEGYRSVSIGKSLHLEHRLIWLIVTGGLPIDEIDHIDGDRTNNAWMNLREATRSANQQNLRRANIDSKSGLLGVVQSGRRWRAGIKVNGTYIHLGTHDTPSEASAAYMNAKRVLHPASTITTKEPA